MKIYLIRHGATTGNLEHRYVGTTDEELLPESVDSLRRSRMRYPAAQLVFASPMKRCIQTAQQLFPGRMAEILEDLRECSFGAFEYKNYQELSGDARYQSWIDSGGTIAFPGGESREAFAARCCNAFVQGCREAEKQQCGSVAFVVHGGTIMAVLERFSSPSRPYFDWQCGNGTGYAGELTEENGVLQIREITPLPQQTDPIGIEEHYVLKNHQKLHCGYTTGSCSTAAARAATDMLLGRSVCSYADIQTPKGISLHLPVLDPVMTESYASCAVRKYGGDDPDATDGLLIYARAELLAGETPDVVIDGGTGVGRVTREGLEQPVGAAAINRVPREMIRREVRAVLKKYGYTGGIRITVSVPDGAEIAKKTFNPHLGIEGGISILGTSGIVMPMSEDALIASIRVEMKQKRAQGEEYLLITPGNYGADFIRRKELSRQLDAEQSMKCSNYVGETLDMAVQLQVKGILFVAHIGKFIKVSGGVMNTHSAHADCRAELMAAQAMRAGADEDTVRRLLSANTTEEAVDLLQESGMLDQTIQMILDRIQFYLQKRCQGQLETEVILFSNRHGYLGESAGADRMMESIIRQNQQNTGG